MNAEKLAQEIKVGLRSSTWRQFIKARKVRAIAAELQLEPIVTVGTTFRRDGGIWTVVRQGRGAWVCQEFANGTFCEFYTSQIVGER